MAVETAVWKGDQYINSAWSTWDKLGKESLWGNMEEVYKVSKKGPLAGPLTRCFTGSPSLPWPPTKLKRRQV